MLANYDTHISLPVNCFAPLQHASIGLPLLMITIATVASISLPPVIHTSPQYTTQTSILSVVVNHNPQHPTSFLFCTPLPVARAQHLETITSIVDNHTHDTLLYPPSDVVYHRPTITLQQQLDSLLFHC